MSYRSFTLLTAAARRPEIWRLALGLLLAVVVTFGLAQVLLGLLLPLAGTDSLNVDDSPLGLLVLLLSMGAMAAGAAVSARLLHGRPFLSLIGPPGLALRQGLRVAVALALLSAAIVLLPPWPLSADLQPGLPPVTWLALLPLTLLALLVQTGSEEILFRGYLQSQLAARLPWPAVWLVLPSALFALGHHAPAIYGANAGLVTLWAFVFGLAMADLTARSGTLGPAIAFHFVNNFMAIGLIAPQGDMAGLALYLWPFDTADTSAMRAMLLPDLMTLGLGWLAARLALRV